MIERRGQAGQGILEVGLLFVLVVVVVLLSLNLFGVSTREMYCSVINAFGIDACQQTYFSDDFNDLDQWQVIRGNWSIEDGNLCIKRGGRIFADIPQSGDYQVVLSGAEMTRGNGFGIMFRASNYSRDNSYIFQYDPGYARGSMIFRERANGREYRPSATNRLGRDYSWYNTPHDIRVVVSGDTFTAFVDDEQVLQTQDSTWTEGGIGLRSWDNTNACFDRITVEPLQ